MAKIILAIDASEHSERAFEFYLKEIHKEGNEVFLVHALEYPYIPGQPYVRQEIIKDLFDKVREDGERIDDKFKELCKRHQIQHTVCTEFSSPGEYICKMAQEKAGTIIIMGTRGMGTIRRTILGSVSDYVVHHAHCPVLIARK